MSDAGSHAGPDEPGVVRKAQQAEDLARAKAAGWADPIPFNYEAAVPGTAGPEESRDTVAWLSDAVIYAWDDDFGDVGAPNPELEKMLFADEFIQRAGASLRNLAAYDVEVTGPEKVKPVREVSLSILCVPRSRY